jgi:hypothetical protein
VCNKVRTQQFRIRIDEKKLHWHRMAIQTSSGGIRVKGMK